jgi:hypothetical protein
VEIEVPTNPDGLSKPVILDKTLWGEVDPWGVSIYEIPAEKKKLPADDWVNVEDLGMDDDTRSRNLPRKVNIALKRGPQGQAKM